MAGGPFLPSSAFAVGALGQVFPNVHVGAGGGAPNVAVQMDGLGFANATDLTGDRNWSLYFLMPTTLPSGTAKFGLAVLAAAEIGDLSIVPSWASVAFDEDPSAATLNSEGPDPDERVGGDGSDGDNSTFGWATGDDDVFLKAVWILNADTVVAGEWIVMSLAVIDADTDLAAVPTLVPYVFFED